MKLKQLVDETKSSIKKSIFIGELKVDDGVYKLDEEMENHENYGNPMVFRDFYERLYEHPDFKDDLELISMLYEVKRMLPDVWIPLPSKMSAHFICSKNSRWRIRPWTTLEPTPAMLYVQYIFSEIAYSLYGSKGNIAKKLGDKMRGLRVKYREKDKRVRISLKPACNR